MRTAILLISGTFAFSLFAQIPEIDVSEVEANIGDGESLVPDLSFNSYRLFQEDFESRTSEIESIKIFVGLDDEKPIVEISDSVLIETLLSFIKFDLEESGGVCLCSPDFTIQFQSRDQKAVRIGIIDGYIFRWVGGPWEGEAHLTQDSMAKFVEFLIFTGIENPIGIYLPAPEIDNVSKDSRRSNK